MIKIFIPQKIFLKMSLNTFEIKDLIMLKSAFSLNYEEFRKYLIMMRISLFLRIELFEKDIFMILTIERADIAFFENLFTIKIIIFQI